MFVPAFVKYWLFISSIIVTWDYTFVLFRPRSMPGGDLHHIWSPYKLYIQIDTLYGKSNDLFIIVQSWFNMFETFLSLFCFIVLCFKNPKLNIFGALLAMVCSSFTFWKTCIYFAYDNEFVNHQTNYFNLIFLFYIPNSFWIIMPFLSFFLVGRRIYMKLIGLDLEKNEMKKKVK